MRIPLRDGAHLNATLYLSENAIGAMPAIFTLTPYVGQTYHERGLYFAAHDYPFLTIDVRGRGNSEGAFRPFIQEAADGFDVVEWLARQPFCDGRVAMWGGSYGGHDQWATAKERPPHLATIVPVASPYVGLDYPLRYNAMSPYLMQWLTLVAGRTAQDRIFADDVSIASRFWARQFKRWLESGTPFRSLDQFTGNPSNIFQEWVAHPHPDHYWDQYNPTSQQYSELSLPILTITGLYDGNQLGALTHYREHIRHASAEFASQHHLLIGPWDHAGTRTPAPEFGGIACGVASLIDMNELHRQWYAWTLQSGPPPSLLRKRVTYYMMGVDEWRYADTLEAITAQVVPYHLHSSRNPVDVFSSGSLARELPPAQAEPDSYVYDPRDLSLAELESTIDPECLVDQRLVLAATGRQLVYHTAPFDRDIEIAGFPRFTTWIGIDCPDTDIRVTVYEISLNGESVLLSMAAVRARYRENLREAKLVSTIEPLRYDFDQFTLIARRVRRGHRLRLVIGPMHSIYWQKNYNSGGVVADESMTDARAVTVRLYHDRSRPSALHVPLARPVEQ